MYGSIKKWLNIPVTIKPLKSRTGTGSKLYGEDIEALCYRVDEVKIVRNIKGVEVVSNTQIFLDGTQLIDTNDAIELESKIYEIQAISTFYRAGKPDLKVVYI